MKNFELDLSEYSITVQQPVIKKNEETGKEEHVFENVSDVYPLRDNISVWLRSIGVFKCGEDIAEAVSLAKRVLAFDADFIRLDEREAEILKKAIDRHIALTHDDRVGGLGGPLHEEAICRIVGMKEVK
ncbi:MAG: hypothetical protein ACW99U_16995 [Candidatus Thorarchaeota archaeon]|jgi:hypothetical protein